MNVQGKSLRIVMLDNLSQTAHSIAGMLLTRESGINVSLQTFSLRQTDVENLCHWYTYIYILYIVGLNVS